MAGILGDNLFNAGMGILAANQRSPVYQNPVTSMQNSMMQGQQQRQMQQQQLAAQQKAKLDAEYKQAQIAEMQAKMSLPPEKKIIKGNDGFNYYMDGSRVLPNVEAKTNPNQPFNADGTPNPAYQEYEKNLRVSGATTNSVTVANEAKAKQPLTGAERDSYRMKDGSPLPVGASMEQLIAMGDQVIPVDKRAEDTKKAFNEKYAEAELVANKVTGSLNVYRDILKKGTKIIPGEDKLKLSGAYTDVQMQLKDLLALGVLAGEDLNLIKAMAADPTSFIASYAEGKEPGALDAQLQLIQDKIDRELAYAGRAYGQKPKNGNDITQLPEGVPQSIWDAQTDEWKVAFLKAEK